MPSHFAQTEPRILLTAIQEMDKLARRFRRRLREVGVELSRKRGYVGPIGPDAIREAVPLACQELLTDIGSDSTDERGLDGETPEAA